MSRPAAFTAVAALFHYITKGLRNGHSLLSTPNMLDFAALHDLPAEDA